MNVMEMLCDATFFFYNFDPVECLEMWCKDNRLFYSLYNTSNVYALAAFMNILFRYYYVIVLLTCAVTKY